MSEVKPLTEEQITKLHDEVDRRLDAARQWKRGVEDCGWCGQRGADRNEHPCLIAAETSAAYIEAERDALIATVRQLQQENGKLMASRRVHELDNHHNALACGYCAGPLRDELTRLQQENKRLTKSLRTAYDFYMGPQASGSFTCICDEPRVCGICEIREATELVLAADLLATSPVVNCNPPEQLK